MMTAIIQLAAGLGSILGLFWVMDVWARGGSDKAS
jgi:hypothetical protein